tara:strand:+ start:10804 stop:11034 length:231 start_codon:yes stop_codon:yes gene_type:complete
MSDTIQTQTANLPLEATVLVPRLWDQKTLAAYIGKSIAWCERARWKNEGPKFIHLGRNVRYKVEDVLNWIESEGAK